MGIHEGSVGEPVTVDVYKPPVTVESVVHAATSSAISGFSMPEPDSRFTGLFETLGLKRGYRFAANDRWQTVDAYWEPKAKVGKIDLDAEDDDDDDDDPFAGLKAAVALAEEARRAAVQEVLASKRDPNAWLVQRLEPAFTCVGLVVLGPPGYPACDTLFEADGVVFLLSRSGDTVSVGLLAESLERLSEVHATLRLLFPEQLRPAAAAPDGTPRVTVNFWSWGSHGPDVTPRQLEMVDWEKSKHNYPRTTQDQLAELMTWTPARSGQLLIWHGPPGTGKTWGIRALAWAWREWCTVHYVMDPAQLLAGPPGYLKALFLHQDRVRPGADAAKRPMWRLVILEDTSEVIAATAKQEAGQGLSRLLNIADGLLGQGSRSVIMVTTNEQVDKLHEAVMRPGRCAANIVFPSFSRAEAAEWFLQAGVDYTPTKDMSLAQMFSIRDERLHQFTVKAAKPSMGFK